MSNDIDFTDAEAICLALAEELYAQNLIATPENALSGVGGEGLWQSFFQVEGDILKVVVSVYDADEASEEELPGPGWMVDASFESSRPPVAGVQSWSGETLADLIDQVRRAVSS